MIKDLNIFTVKQFSSIFHLSLPFCLEHELQLWQKLPFPSQHKSQMAVNREKETFKREATFRTKPPFQALNRNPSSHFPRCICFLLQPPVFISPFSHHLVLLPPSPRFLTLCSPAQTLTAAVSSLCQGLEHVSVLLRDTKFDNNLEAVQLALRCPSPKKGVWREIFQRFVENTHFTHNLWRDCLPNRFLLHCSCTSNSSAEPKMLPKSKMRCQQVSQQQQGGCPIPSRSQLGPLLLVTIYDTKLHVTLQPSDK